MLRKVGPALTLLLTVSGVCLAENAAGPAAGGPAVQTSPALPAMVVPWTRSEDYARYDDPRDAIRRRAEWKAEQRRTRMAARQWMGYSPQRPPASPIPSMGSYSTFVGIGAYYPWPGITYRHGLPYAVVGQADATTSR